MIDQLLPFWLILTPAVDVLLNAGQHRYFQVTISLIVVSILLQVIVGIIFIVLGRLNINFAQDRRKADMMNNASVILIFMVRRPPLIGN